MRLRKLLMVTLISLMSFGLTGEIFAKAKEPRKWKTITYKVKPGDTLTDIAKKHNTTPEKLMKWNKGLKPTALQIGQPLKIAVINPDWKRWKATGGKSNKAVAKKKKKKRTTSKKVAAKKSSSSKEASDKKVASKSDKVAVATKKDASDSDLPPKKLAKGDVAEPPREVEKVVAAPGFDDTPDYIPAKPVAPRGPLPETFEFKGETLPVVENRSMLDKDTKRAVYFAREGDNVGTIALEFGLDPEDVLYWNDLERVTLTPREPIVFKFDAAPRVPKKRLPVNHRVKRGDTYEKIAKKYGVSVKQLKRWNPKVNPRKLRIGQTIRMNIPGRDGRSVSYGTANRGRLYNGVALESTYGLKVRSVANAYGTERVVRLLKASTFDVKARWPDAADLVVGDISYRRGGRIKKHKSHQSGRDADVSFYYRGNAQTRDFVDMERETFDAVKNWHIFKTLIDTGEVEYIFIDYPLQKVLYEYALGIGYTPDELEPILQYPRPKSMGVGIIRHVRGHDDHWHIRFKCGPADRHCR